ncbi:nuclease-related domain-containing protein [Neobacillus sp. 114]|uniref:nuclease-related domain-containing protein n=1 Tax=Neobacillus sp. 114 TaxID=3048535 RepID=UPI0024C2CAB8|nr:nuclease-related domain-containing protein [Neobacillus sp. 114]
MIIKPRFIPLIILILEALLRRLRKTHPKWQLIADELAGRWAGYRGEQSIDFYLHSLPEKEYHIFHDLNLPDGEYNCQIDTFLLTSKSGIIIDVKNNKGKNLIDTDSEQLIQKVDGEEIPYPYPIFQVERHQRVLNSVLAENNLPTLPLEYLVVFSNPNAILSFVGRNGLKVMQHICKSPSILHKIELFENFHKQEKLDPKELRKLDRLLLKLNTIPTKPVLKKFDIVQGDLLPGVHCPNCLHLPVQRKNQNWYCPTCDTFVPDAHLYTIQDYFLLYGPTITNQQFREFAQISSPDLARRLLHSANLKYVGVNKARVYFPVEIPFIQPTNLRKN